MTEFRNRRLYIFFQHCPYSWKRFTTVPPPQEFLPSCFLLNRFGRKSLSSIVSENKLCIPPFGAPRAAVYPQDQHYAGWTWCDENKNRTLIEHTLRPHGVGIWPRWHEISINNVDPTRKMGNSKKLSIHSCSFNISKIPNSVPRTSFWLPALPELLCLIFFVCLDVTVRSPMQRRRWWYPS